MECKAILMRFGAVSGLHIIWNQTKAAFIPDGPPPPRFYLFSWTWEENSNASNLLGCPMAAGYAIEQTERLLTAKIDKSLEKLKARHISLAGRVVVANGLILSTIWYLITVWAGDVKFFTKLQSRIENFVWNGRSRVDRNTTTLSKNQGGLGLLLIEEQHRAIAGNIMLWTMGPSPHPLRRIYQSHVHELSEKKWGSRDLTWIVSPGGGTSSRGSAAWQNISRAWAKLKPSLSAVTPRNEDEWRQLPIWRPHRNHITHTNVKCSSQGQRWLRQLGPNTMGDFMAPDGRLAAWQDIYQGPTNNRGERAFRRVVENLRDIPALDDTPILHPLFFEAVDDRGNQCIWQYNVPAADTSLNWAELHTRFNPIRTLYASGGALLAGPHNAPTPRTLAYRVLLRLPAECGPLHHYFGQWNPENAWLTQYQWTDGTALLNTSTRQLHRLLARQRSTPHSALQKWTTSLACEIPPTIWGSIWVSSRGASENVFLWQLLYRIIATQKWRFPRSSATDPHTWCTRCTLGIREDIIHCIWNCPISALCWRWCEYLLSLASTNRTAHIALLPANIFVAWPLPLEWQIPPGLWLILRPILCWQIWKDRNGHYLANTQPTISVSFGSPGIELALTFRRNGVT